MKSKTTVTVPDSFYGLFGIYVPENGISPSDSSVRFFTGSDRIGTLKKESRYRSYFPVLKKISLLSLNYPSLPQDSAQKTEYVKKVIKESIRKALTALSPDRKLNADCCRYIETFFGLSPDSVSVEICSRGDDMASDLACRVLDSTEAVRITFPKLNGTSVFANPFSKKNRKTGCFQLRSNHAIKVQITDLIGLLGEASLFNVLHETLDGTDIPLIRDVYERCADDLRHLQAITRDEMLILQFIESGKPIPYECLFRCSQVPENISFRAGMACGLSSWLYRIFCGILEITQDISHENRLRERLACSVATAYMTKKNIPERIQKAMESSGFTDYFGYVEFDEDVNLNSVAAIEKEFMSINAVYFSGAVFPDVNIRFRKLGRHKASGLYYPGLDTLCVDIRSPSSFMHEYFHMIDNQLGDLSLGVEFQKVVEEYKEAFLEGLKKESCSVQEQMNGNGKYNIHYFFRRAEIFARCGEIYMVRMLKAESSLLKPELNFAYPESDALDAFLRTYFDDLLQKKLAGSSFARAC